MDETEYLLKSKANKKHLLDAIKSKKFTRFTSEEFDEYSKQLIKSTMKDKFEEITEKIKNLLFIKAIVEDVDKDGNEIWRMEAELAGKVIDKYLPKLIDTLHQQDMKEAIQQALKEERETIKAFEVICKIAEVPEILIENPQLIFPSKMTKDDLFWAKKIIDKHKKQDNIEP